MRVLFAVLVLSLSSLAAVCAEAQGPPEPLPKVVAHDDPVYPQIARTAHIMGDVVVKITTDGQSVFEAKAESGPPVLLKAAVNNARTWKFAPHTPGTFHVTYRFMIIAGDVATSFLNSPETIDVVAAPPEMSIDWAWVGLGKWKADLKSTHGRLSEVFEFLFTGPNGEWLRVETPGSPSRRDNEETDDDEEFSRKDGDFLIFTMKLAEPDGRRLETYLVGKMAGDKLVGTFIDESGVRGTWTAARIAESHPDRKRD